MPRSWPTVGVGGCSSAPSMRHRRQDSAVARGKGEDLMAIPVPSEPGKTADEAALEAAVAQATADTQRRQAQAKVFQESRTPTRDVKAGEERL
jgi:hypothetical protein